MKNWKRILASGVAASALAASLCATAPASAATGAETEGTSTVSLPMAFSGYDATAAEQNGYAIVTDATGARSSVPVSADAIAFEQQLARQASSRTAYVDGPCGSSWINAKSSGQRKTITTGYVVTHPVIAKTWTVQVWGWSGLPSFTWSGPSGATWFSSWAFNGGGDFANVLPGSNVVMSNGAVCVSGSPGENFHS
ncbi:hypothetical protein LLS1_31500 [Leifsonia sp. LS1]|uniref:hypothetical protein n=1 Tax=Leifsonia sp. LS1 TaxID=2828483 RepID=UPI001CFDDEBE|nr:hypothetical protein [Leifsonia sp. LS1]GIT81481.1 hypothetical protein LLS1_31500 [Leifsonia sp. LS1]